MKLKLADIYNTRLTQIQLSIQTIPDETQDLL